MTPRRFPLPLTALSLTAGTAPTLLATGCTPSIVGEWTLTEFEYDGNDLTDYLDGNSESYEYNGCTYTETESVSFVLKVENDKGELEAEFTQSYSESYSNSCDPSWNYSNSYSYDYDTDIEKGDDGVWEIDVDELDWKLECTVDGDEMMCEGDYEGYDIEAVFERE
jgi:hypothetical protein